MSSEKAVKEWLVKTGYPLEMEVANVFRNRGLHVFQSDYYMDPQSNEYREIDVVALSSHQIGNEGNLVKFEVLCECKTSRDKPWLMFVDDSAKPNDRLLIFNRVGNQFATRLFARAATHIAGTAPPLFAFDRTPAYGVTQALRKKHNDLDATYSALMQAANAARVRAADSDLVYKDPPIGSMDAEVFIPVVVVDSELFDVSLGQDWAPTLTPVERQVVMWRNPVGGRPFTVIHVVRKDRVGTFVSDLKEGFGTLYEWCDKNLQLALKALRRPQDDAADF
jgi:hypothetical protein